MPKIKLTEENIGKRVKAADIEGVIERCWNGTIEFIGRNPNGDIIEARPKSLHAVNTENIPLCDKPTPSTATYHQPTGDSDPASIQLYKYHEEVLKKYGI